MNQKSLFLALIIPSLAAQAQSENTSDLSRDAQRVQRIRQELQQFELNPKAFLNRKIPKLDVNSKPKKVVRTAFDAQSIQSKEFILQKDKQRQKMKGIFGGATIRLGDVMPGRAPEDSANAVETLIGDDNILRGIKEMDSLRNRKLKTTPWSDDYWPLYQGSIARRYADPYFPLSPTFSVNKKYGTRSWEAFLSFFFDGIKLPAAFGELKADMMAPSEKYDLVIGGNPAGLLTASAWSEGEDFAPKVETWMGLCHGWAAAAIAEKRPSSAVKVKTVNGDEITFLPSDIKALTTHLYSHANAPSWLIGGRCDTKKPKEDENGRIKDDDCFDINPGTWHKAVVNLIGKRGESFVIDNTFDYEVWNQPVYKYNYTYFNPETKQPVEKLSDAVVARADFKSDVFKKYRRSNAKAFVGINMTVTYIVENEPNVDMKDSPANDSMDSVELSYDLELDSTNLETAEIVGGEWYQNAHPDFLWRPVPGQRAETDFDAYVRGNWTPSNKLPSSWQNAAQEAAHHEGSVKGLPLAKIVRALLSSANGEN